MQLPIQCADAIRDSVIGVVAWVTPSGTPISCAVTPYLVEGKLVITSTLAFPGKARAMRSDPRVSVFAGGWLVSGTARVAVDRTSDWFDSNLRSQELTKYPPARSLLSIPGHRRLFPFYVGRIVMKIDVLNAVRIDGDDRASITYFKNGVLRQTPISLAGTGGAELKAVKTLKVEGNWPDGVAEVLFHEESDDLSDLRQFRFPGTISGGMFTESRRVGDLDHRATSTWKQLGQLRTLRRLAKGSQHEIATWPIIERTSK